MYIKARFKCFITPKYVFLVKKQQDKVLGIYSTEDKALVQEGKNILLVIKKIYRTL